MSSKFYRLPDKGVFSGVCAGLAESYGFSRNGLRAGLVLLCFFGVFPVFIAYLALSFVMPIKGAHATAGLKRTYDLSIPSGLTKYGSLSPQLSRRQASQILKRNSKRLARLESYLVSEGYKLDRQYKTLEDS